MIEELIGTIFATVGMGIFCIFGIIIILAVVIIIEWGNGFGW